jgi:hypothetical protein
LGIIGLAVFWAKMKTGRPMMKNSSSLYEKKVL